MEKKDIPIVLLHGWGSTMSGKRYEVLKKLLEKDGYTVYTPDLPGFGDNVIEKEALHFEDYITFVQDFIKKTIQAKKVILIGHSFGGRLAIRFTAKYPNEVERLILTGASGIPHALSLKKKVIYGITKLTRPLFTLPPFSFLYRFFRKIVYRSIGEMDYYKSGSLQQTFKNVYQVSIVADLAKIAVPTLIVWGELDTFTPLVDGKFMQEKIPNAELIVIPKASHKLPYEKPEIFAQFVNKFLV